MKILAGMAAALLFSVALAHAKDPLPYVDEECAQSFSCNETVIWELLYQGSVVSFGDMDRAECEALKAEIEEQTKPFTELKCRARLVEREKI